VNAAENVLFRYKDPNMDPRHPGLSVRFREHEEKNDKASAESGFDTFDNVLVAYVAPVGQPKSEASCEIERKLPDGTVKVHPVHARKYAELVKLYKEGAGEGSVGTPLKLLNLTPGTIATLRARGVHSVEMLADLADSAGGELMGFRGDREKAQQFLALRERNAPMVAVDALKEEHAKEIASLRRQLEEMNERFGEPELRKPGRPRKQIEEAA
jgi:hypothetical protein